MGRFYKENQKRPIGGNVLELRSIVICIVLVGILSTATAARAASSAYFTGSNDVSQQFESGQVLPGHRYYAGGPELKPNALVAIDESYTLNSPYWRPIEPTTASLKKLTGVIKFVQGAEYKISPNGARIFTAAGSQVGVWYSVFEFPPIKMPDDRQIYIGDPVPRLPVEVQRKIRRSDD